MISKEKLIGYTPIPDFDGYYFDKEMNPCVVIVSKGMVPHIKRLHVYNSNNPNIAYVEMRKLKGENRERVYINNLLGLGTTPSVSKNHKPKYTKIISLNQMRNRTPLTRTKIINYLLMERPTIQIPLTPNKEGLFETGRGMKEIGMHVCCSCGNIQPLEFKLCKHCNNFITI